MLGGISGARTVPDAMVPRENEGLYFLFSMTGKAILPNVAVAAMVEPDIAPKTALPKMTDTARPPGK